MERKTPGVLLTDECSIAAGLRKEISGFGQEKLGGKEIYILFNVSSKFWHSFRVAFSIP